MESLQYITQQFGIFNRKYFEGVLPMPRLLLSCSKTRLGSFSCKRSRRLFRSRLTDFTIRISNYYVMTERQVQNILLHEMIHYYIAYQGIKDTSAHGIVFRQMANRLNSQYGWQITVSTNTRGWEISENAKERKQKAAAERLILVLEMKDGTRFLSVVNPKYAVRLEKQIKRVFDIQKHAWYLSSDSRFSDYPQVRSLRGKRLSESQFNDFINSGAKSVEVLSAG